MDGRRLLGSFGENRAAKHLKKNGYTIIERNYRNRIGEIDIIARHRDTIVFVEVKTRRNTLYGSPKAAVHYSKQRKIAATAHVWLKQNKVLHQKARFDVVAVRVLKKNACAQSTGTSGSLLKTLVLRCLNGIGINKTTVHIEIVKNAFQLN